MASQRNKDFNVVVLDIGSACSKAGFSGEDAPSIVLPTVYDESSPGSGVRKQRYMQESCEEYLDAENTNLAISNVVAGMGGQYAASNDRPISRGVVKDWDLMQKYCDVLLGELGISESDGASIMLVENPLTVQATRIQWAECFFANSYYNAPALCFGNSSSMCIFSSGRTTGVAVELGAGITSSVPVFEGLALKHAAITVDKGGQDVTTRLRKLMSDRGIKINYEDTRVLKENMTYVDTCAYGFNNSRVEKTTLSLPDGNEVEIENKLFSDCNNILFQYNLASNYPTGLVHQVGESISLCDDYLRRELSSHIILAGGCSMTAGLGDRLGAELSERLNANANANANTNTTAPNNNASTSLPASGALKLAGGGLANTIRNNLNGAIFDIRVFPSTSHRESGYTNQRRFAPWIGGSIFGSLETFNDLKLTRQEWEESGERLLLTKCY